MAARWRKLGVIAGGGALPARIAAACQARGDPYHVIRIVSDVDKKLVELPGDDCRLGEFGKVLRVLKQQECDAVVFAGVVRRPDFKALKVDWRGTALLSKLVPAAAHGDGAILNTLVESFEAEGLLVVGAEEAMQELTAPEGSLGSHKPSPQDVSDIRKAAEVINALGAFDVGQAAVVVKGHVLAIEAAEGTDAMLERCVRLRAYVNGEARLGVLVKRPKPGQERRVDLPVVGPETIRRAAEAGLAGIAVEAEAALIIDRDEVVRHADEAGLFVYGFTRAEANTP